MAISTIDKTHTGKGNPNAVTHYDRPLNNRQQNLLNNLPEYDSKTIVRKREVNMNDLATLTAVTGNEFAMFTKGNERLIIRGDDKRVNVDEEYARQLNAEGYRFSGHTHVGTDYITLTASQGDYEILDCFNHDNSIIYNALGRYSGFNKNDRRR